MNKIRRKALRKALELIDEAKSIIEACRDEEQEAFDNLPEGLQESERGEAMAECIYQMEDAMDSAESISDALTKIVEG